MWAIGVVAGGVILAAAAPTVPDYGPHLERFTYPWPVQTMTADVVGQPATMAFMDVAPARPNGRVVVLMHGKNFCGATWESTARTLSAPLVNLRDGGFASAHDFHLARTLAGVMCGGDVDPGAEVDDAWILRLEREAFTGLLDHPKTQERLLGMVQTGKAVRN